MGSAWGEDKCDRRVFKTWAEF